eukprot:Gregarina_sp_Poly_1__8963@NODE_543_length_7587_cov_73_728590_g430_i0_p4_GENE_NODE_543_length_7587_cov_73_728590_g430_i0NODE_543_length_7587_cov_73_728590_g430_i0_p4_ORF_typecomplete_len156_score13_04_NODE_543_length_7587_cov_73_728590_g430_i029253392
MNSKENVPPTKQTPFPIRVSLAAKNLTSTEQDSIGAEPKEPPKSHSPLVVQLRNSLDTLDSFINQVKADWIQLTGFRASDWSLVESQLHNLLFTVEKKGETDSFGSLYFLQLLQTQIGISLNWMENVQRRSDCGVTCVCSNDICQVAKKLDCRIE